VGGAAAALAVLSIAAGCGGSDDSAKASAPATSTPAAGGSTAAPAEPGPAPEVVNIQASEWAYTISGSPHAGLVELHVSNLGEASHEIGLVRVKDGVTLDQVKQALASGEEAARALQVDPDTEITSAGIAGPHVNEHVVVPLVAGHYIVSSFLPGPDGRPQAARGMMGEFTVLDAAGTPPVPPETAGTVELTDTSIELPADFAKGGTFEVTNTGTKPHDFSVAQLADQPLPAYFQCVAQSFGSGTSVDDCPGVLQGGVTTMQPGESAYVTVVFGPGSYGYVSTYGDGADFKAGLNGTFTNP
jgi:hypothetical protein